MHRPQSKAVRPAQRFHGPIVNEAGRPGAVAGLRGGCLPRSLLIVGETTGFAVPFTLER